MANFIEGNLIAEGLNLGIVVARFNEFIGSRLLSGALDCWKRHEGSESKVDVVWVPGAFEIPLAAKTMALSNRYHAIICLGAVIRGATSHYDLVVNEAAKGVSQASEKSGIPVIFGVLTTDTIEQAIERAGTKAGNKGWECTMAAIEMANLMRKLKG